MRFKKAGEIDKETKELMDGFGEVKSVVIRRGKLPLNVPITHIPTPQKVSAIEAVFKLSNAQDVYSDVSKKK